VEIGLEGTREKTRTRASEETRANIIDVATREFVDKGLAGARIDVIAEKTNSSKRMIYYYFGSKDGLYRSVLEEAYVSIRAREEALDFDSMSAEEALRALVLHTFNYHFSHPGFVRLVMNENILHGAHIGEVHSIKDRNRSGLARLKGILDKGVAEGVFRSGLDPLDVHLTMSALCFYNVSNRYTLHASFDIDLASEPARLRREKDIVDTVLAAVRRHD
jgi:AcrR family transcriptional regulator